MPEVTINYLAVVVSAVIGVAIGFVWYSNALFGKQWRMLVGIHNAAPDAAEKIKKQMPKALSATVVGSLVTAYVLAHFLSYAGAADIVGGLRGAFWIWLGFVAPVLLTMYLYQQKSIRLFFIDSAYQLLVLLVMGAVLASWI